MLYTVDNSLRNFDFWSGGLDFAKRLTAQELDQIEDEMTNCDFWGGNTPTDTQINDLFWFEPETVCELIGLDCDEVWNRE